MSLAASTDGRGYLWHRRFALGCLSLMLILPFQIAYHRLPIPSFYEEWWTALLGLGTMSLLVHRRHAFQLPGIAVLPAILIACLALQIAFAAGKHSNPAQIALLCLIWSLGLMLAATALRQEIGIEAMARLVAGALLVGALLAAWAAVLQISGTGSGLGVIMPHRGAQLIGNVGQPNHLADQLWLGIAAAIYLRATRQLTAAFALAAIGLLTAIAVLTGSRSIWLYAALLIALAIVFRRGEAVADRSLVLWCASALALQLLAQLLLPWLLSDGSGLVTAGERLYTDVGTSSIRLGLWTMALHIWTEHPLFGAGWGSFPAETYAFIGALPANLPAGVQFRPGENAHNVVLAMLSELGLVAGVAVVACPLAWLLRIVRRPVSREQALCLALLAVISLHSQLEYPLWYLNFLAVAALASTLADPVQWPASPRRLAPPVTAFLLVAGAAALLILRHDYHRLESALAWPQTPAGEAPHDLAEIKRELVELRGRSLFSGYVDMALAGTMTLDRDGLRDKVTVAELAKRFSPTERVVFKHAALLALDGQADAARRAWLQALAAYPDAGPQVYRAAAELSPRFPELAALRDLAAAYGRPGAI